MLFCCCSVPFAVHDEAAPLYTEMVDQTTRGHQFLLKNFGPAANPRGTWQIDPFGHSNTEAWLLGAEAGMESLFWGRTDYQVRAAALARVHPPLGRVQLKTSTHRLRAARVVRYSARRGGRLPFSATGRMCTSTSGSLTPSPLCHARGRHSHCCHWVNQDLNMRMNRSAALKNNQWPQWIWQGSQSLGSSAQVLAGQLGSGGYGTHIGWNNAGGVIQDNPTRHDYNLDQQVDEFINWALQQNNYVRPLSSCLCLLLLPISCRLHALPFWLNARCHRRRRLSRSSLLPSDQSQPSDVGLRQ